ncbi:DNA polymerase III subunit gamma and tau [Microbacterium sp. MM2322]|uniref:DNA polymerase III subunit gamma and tau n=1 Tax=Microbacterium sp. MM2322 TaxID=3157631 RepID=UPI0032D5AD54
MTTALYRRYRPETFGEMIGQSQVTEPLMTALRSDRVGHAYLFSGPRGCGKTTSARILARCLNCAQGPTDTPCGTCDSCVELSRGGGGSLDVVEIDAASHNGVDDARDLRERAVFAPARDRFKIFILDEAHMVTAQGFNALLKLVEEPPAHVKFIFATTEPEKVIGTIRSRTHHYPFRLVAPAAMLEYVEQLCTTEGVTVQPGVLPLVVRAGGGSPRDTLSLLDQLIAGSEDGAVAYERAVSLLGYTHAELLDEVVDAFSSHDAAAAFGAVDRVVQTGQDPRRFVDDLLERLRDLIIVAATGEGARAVLRGVPVDELERMARQAASFGTDRLSRIADLVVTALDDMTGTTSPRLQLELLVARVLAATTDAGESAPAVPAAAAPRTEAPRTEAPRTETTRVAPAPAAQTPAPAVPTPEPAPATPIASSEPAPAASPEPPLPTGPVTFEQIRDSWPEILRRLEDLSRTSWMIATASRPVAYAEGDILTLSFQSHADVQSFKKLTAGKGPSEDLRTAILAVLGVRVKYLTRHDTDPTPPPPGGVGPDVPPEPDAPEGGYGLPAAASPPASAPRSAPAAAAPVTEWAVAPIPTDDAAPAAQFAVDDEPEDAAPAPIRTLTVQREGDVLPADAPDDDDDEDDVPPPVDADAPIPVRTAPPRLAPEPQRGPRPGGIERVGEAAVRQLLGARFVREEPYTPPTRFN